MVETSLTKLKRVGISAIPTDGAKFDERMNTFFKGRRGLILNNGCVDFFKGFWA
ncbi:hypothetical protein D8674_000353 [Pyrus ussuriensis x Pyrus communis]|uniref:Uncharacterized protein n=1 Tax=Pyrus ussuriensis x Pyrus communis TaxID=2448454 RepID=A0A5N5F3U5_9ROSA|nr:hypothetical protein D8674_000353 [Pyrus ussuriensis x Pyrus communis]